MVINNLGHTKRCNSRCEAFDGYQTYCPHREPMQESRHDYLYRMHKMRSDTSYERITVDREGETKHFIIQEKGFSISFGRCNRDEIVTMDKKVRVRKKIMVGGVL